MLNTISSHIILKTYYFKYVKMKRKFFRVRFYLYSYSSSKIIKIIGHPTKKEKQFIYGINR